MHGRFAARTERGEEEKTFDPNCQTSSAELCRLTFCGMTALGNPQIGAQENFNACDSYSRQ